MRPMLADILPSVVASYGGPGADVLALPETRDTVVLLVDGLGARLLERHRDVAPTLAAAVVTTVQAGFPATTATSLSSLAIGAPCATHGIIGYSFALPGPDGLEPFNALRWRIGEGKGTDARETIRPEGLQQVPSGMETLAAHGVDIHYVVPEYQIRSGLTRAAFRAPGTLHAAPDLESVCAGIRAVADHSDRGSRFAYAYYPKLDMDGHRYGPSSAEWTATLADVDRAVAELMSDLPSTCTLLITGDHGMITAGDIVDLDADPELHRNVAMIAGEARVRHVYNDPDAAADVAARWSDLLGRHAHVVTREQALDEHWFGPTPPLAAIRQRIGNVVAVAQGTSILARPSGEPMESLMIGHHGAWTDDEQLVPLIMHRALT